MIRSRWRKVAIFLGSILVILFYSISEVLADIQPIEAPPGSFEMIILLMLTIVGVMAIFALIRRGGIKLMRRGQK